MRPLKKVVAAVLIAATCLLSGCNLTGWKGTKAVETQDAAEKEIPKAESISEEEYVYQTLDDETKQVYDEVLNVILKHEKSAMVSTNSKETLDIAYNAVNADYGGLFWISGYIYTQHYQGDDIVGMDFSPSYTMTKEERDNIQKQIDKQADEMLSGISIEDSDYDKVKYVFETLIEQVEYDPKAENNQNIISVFLNKETVCQGYACATQYLLNYLGLQSAIVTGKADGESHAWNLVKMDGEYYYVDTTWGNSRYLSEDSEKEKYVNYNYLGMTSEEISISHQAKTAFALPECIAVEDNYYVHEGRCFSAWDPDEIGELYAKAWQEGEKRVSVKFSTQELYEKALNFFIKEKEIVDYCDGITTMYYIEDKEQRILTISF